MDTPFPPLVEDGAMYQDLRGFVFRYPVRDMTLDSVDLSYGGVDYAGSLIDITADRSLFVGGTWDTNLSRTFRHCRFDGAKLTGTTIFGGSSFTDCSFVRANMQGAKATAATFERCDFTNANLKSAHLSDSALVGCAWEGARFLHSSLAHSRITRAGFPLEKGEEITGRLSLPAVILDHVTWLD